MKNGYDDQSPVVVTEVDTFPSNEGLVDTGYTDRIERTHESTVGEANIPLFAVGPGSARDLVARVKRSSK
jgi:hypothetical protein